MTNLKTQLAEFEALDKESESMRIKHDFDTSSYVLLPKIWPKDYATDMMQHIRQQAELIEVLVKRISETIEENLHLADGYGCTLLALKQALATAEQQGFGV